MTKEERIAELQIEIKIRQEEIDKLQQELLGEELSGVEDIVKRFEIWAYSDSPKKHHSGIFDCVAPSRGRKTIYGTGSAYEYSTEIEPDLFEYDGILHWEKYQTLTIDCIADYLLDAYEEACKHPEGKLFNWEKKERIYDKEDILYWMKTLMEENFGSCVMDW